MTNINSEVTEKLLLIWNIKSEFLTVKIKPSKKEKRIQYNIISFNNSDTYFVITINGPVCPIFHMRYVGNWIRQFLS